MALGEGVAALACSSQRVVGGEVQVRTRCAGGQPIRHSDGFLVYRGSRIGRAAAEKREFWESAAALGVRARILFASRESRLVLLGGDLGHALQLVVPEV